MRERVIGIQLAVEHNTFENSIQVNLCVNAHLNKNTLYF